MWFALILVFIVHFHDNVALEDDESPEKYCFADPERGPCDEDILSYYYNATSGRCEQFIYGGCEGNDNQFENKAECLLTCYGIGDEMCYFEKDPGPCYGMFKRYYYDLNTDRCKEFIYGGCLGNYNNFKSKQICETTCRPWRVYPDDNDVDLVLQGQQNLCSLLEESDGTDDSQVTDGSDDSDGSNGSDGPDDSQVTDGSDDSDGSNGPDGPDDSDDADDSEGNEVAVVENVCLLPKVVGPCNAALKRYYFNIDTGKCELFTYGGCQGNGNNFHELHECEETCISPVPQYNDCWLPKVVGPCLAYMPRYYFNSTTGQCEKFIYGGCDGNANNFPTLEKCEDTCESDDCKDICTLPKVVGPCKAAIPRFYFDIKTGKCEKFTYGGCQGNANNFHTLNECEDRCPSEPQENICWLPEDVGPCTALVTRYYYSKLTEKCEKFTYGGCKGNANNFLTISDCQKRCERVPPKSVCELPKKIGPCMAVLQRWYYNKSTGQCNMFYYGGCFGNGNNFYTLDECRNTCKPVVPVDVCKQPKKVGPCKQHLARYYYNQNTGQCQLFYYGGCLGNGNNFLTLADCLKRCKPGPQKNDCWLPKVVGPCLAYMPRYYFNTTTGQCEKFIYGGCGGNANNFPTLDDCEDTCEPDDCKGICSLPKVVGPCTAAIPRYYFNIKTGKCEKFTYGGCQGNANNFDSLKECEDKCTSVLPKSVCDLPKKVGPCTAVLPRWYFNKSTGQCEIFYYGGCFGNRNNFATLAECKYTCVPVIPIDVCKQPKKVGPCNQHLARYYYNQNTGQCQLFYYGGCLGNGNNFLTLADCQKRCRPVVPIGVCKQPKKVGPCNQQIPRYYYNQNTGQCQLFFYGGCQGNSNNFLTLDVCRKRCGGPVNVCYEPKIVGPCTQNLPRYYYNSITGQCQLFYYGGCLGNGNNFLTLAACQKQCKPVVPVDVCKEPKKVGPCNQQLPRYYYNQATGQCQLFYYGGCQGNGNNFLTLAACQKKCKPVVPVDVCKEPKKVGPCNQQLPRYYYNQATGQCQLFYYGGCQGNGNNFLTLAACQKKCKPVVPVDVCKEPKKVGPCNQQLPRYYYNQATGQCQLFYYGGCQGNGNNFLTLAACQKKCKPVVPVDVCKEPKKVGPCNQQLPRYYYNQATGQCQLFYYGGCQGNGNNFLTLAACQKKCKPVVPVDVCKEPKKVGPCNQQLPRYYYNQATGQCQLFYYGGCQGNGNNFLTLAACQKKCKPVVPVDVCNEPKKVGPCNQQLPRYYYNQATGQCQLFYYGGCQGNGNNFLTLAACQKKCKPVLPVDVCKEPKKVGPCNQQLPRYYYNQATGQCQLFYYGGCQGNGNNFLTLAACQKKCKPVVPVDVCKEPKKVGPCNQQLPRYYYNQATGQCQLFYYGGCQGNGNNFLTLAACQKKCKPAVPVCIQPKKVGPCNQQLPRYYYNELTVQCELFYYGGCQGNDNNFLTLDACKKKCIPVTPVNVCKQPKVVGPCNQQLPRYYYNQATGQCQLFYYGGCQGNGNNFLTLAACQKKCKPVVPVDVCKEPKKVGPCNQQLPRYYYNQATGQCQLFYYGGCQGNGNNFLTLADCQKKCKPVVPVDVCKEPKKVGPCNQQLPRYYYNQATGQCQLFYYGGCQGNGNNFLTLAACQKKCKPVVPVDVCKEPKKVGPCNQQLPRYYYNQATGQCQLFYYGGCQGNGNNFLNLADCQKKCKPVVPVDVCKEPKKVGPCNQQLPRYYYNQATGQCQLFYYGGCQGNGNNFLTLADCQKKCKPAVPVCIQPKKIGPCNQQLPRYYYNELTVQCELFYYGGCQGNDNNFLTLDACKKKCIPVTPVNVCKQPKVVGPCNQQLPRYYYNQATGQCQLFYYGGCQGNGNNFLTLAACQKKCKPVVPVDVCKEPKKVGPCNQQLPRYYYNQATGQCQLFYYGGCQGNGNNFLTLAACQKKCKPVVPVDVCKEPKKVGPCNQQLPRYYYNQATGQCQLFYYGGCQGNGNNFLTLAACQKKCKPVVPVDVCKEPKKVGPCNQQLPRYYYNQATGQCQLFYYGGCQGNGNNFLTLADCQKKCKPVPPCDVCKEPKKVGPCKQHLTRYYYNQKTGKCEVFIYGGCDGNGNNFKTLEDCQKRCKPVPPCDVCKEPKKVGPCKQHLTRYYYNQKTGKCEIFIYGGCDGNGNNFKTLEDCQKRCKPVPPCDVCKEPKKVGPCKQHLTRYYYNQKTGKCEIFIYGGCDGNGNNFKTLEDCQKRCKPVHPVDVCKEPKKVGPCKQHLTRYYYNQKTGKCEVFIYGGCDGNGNNFKTLGDCQKRCKPVHPVDVCKEPKKIGPCKQHLTRYYYNQKTGKCEIFIYGGCDGNGNNFKTLEDCQKRCKPVHPVDVCKEPKKVGPCKQHLTRYYYNQKTGKCEIFIYGGCDGNGNNFKTLEDCQKRCKPVHPVDVCKEPKKVGPCKQHLTRYYYNQKTGKCEVFIYGGCDGNGNNFKTLEDCQKRCKPVPPCDVCKEPKKVGPCKQHLTRYYYNQKTGKCEVFIYGGCDGNGNNFKTLEDCQKRCKPVHPVDVCKEPKKVGPCKQHLTRYYYNQKTGKCEVFIYGGCDGNGNNFKNLEDCQKRCKPVHPVDVCKEQKKVGPCKQHLTRYYYNQKTGKCEVFIYGGCDGNGNNFKNLEDCQKRCKPVHPVDVCKEPKQVGPCKQHLTRYYYNQKTGKCEVFIYGGCDGNGNNFKTLEDCQKRCKPVPPCDVCKEPKKVGPCKQHLTRYYYNQKTGKCEVFIYGGCDGNGNNFKTLEDCQKRCKPVHPVDVCKEPKKVGPCKQHLTRYYYNQKTGKCEVFIYGGCDGNGNNFKNLEDCQKRCKPVHPVDVCKEPKKVGPCIQHLTRYYYNQKTGKCEVFIYGGCDGNGNNFKTLEDCQKRCKPVPPCDVCKEPKKVGPCKQHLTRYYYNQKTGKCEVFIYGGCDGNGNNFKTLEDCQKRCKPVHPVDVCKEPKKVGPCKQHLTRYYYNQKTGKCEVFIYGGCDGNGNNFKTLEDCQKRCKPVPPCDVCKEPKKVGPCKQHLTRYYYNQKTGKCEVFIYGGCDGNGNNFKTLEDCQKRCKPVHPVDVCKEPKKVGPCKQHLTRYYYNQKTGKCEVFIYGGCDGNGNNFKNLEDCQKRCKPVHPVDVCKEPKKVGPCKQHLTRYYYNQKTGKCEVFIYGGCDGNGNNFKTLEDCQKRCKPVPPCDVCKEPKKVGPCKQHLTRYYYNQKTGKCEVFIYGGCDGNGNNFKTLEDCQKRCKPVHPVDVCKEPKKVGPCKQHLTRYYYNQKTGKCEVFIYGGCDGNGNNFKILEDCQKRCKPVPPCDVCKELKKVGPCKQHLTRYYYNQKTGKCEVFIYGGCDGNGNNFKTLEDCQKRCKPVHPVDVCKEPKKVGPCKQHLTRYYYNQKTGKCEVFIYGGCDGNGNNFKTLEDCQKRCKPVHPVDVCKEPKKLGPCKQHLTRYYYNQKTGKCEVFIYGGCDGNGNNFKNLEDCQKRCKPVPIQICDQPKKVGPCHASLKRYYFDNKTGRCEIFFYGGCEGNENNFSTEAECLRKCLPVPVCEQPKDPGPCEAHIERYYYDSSYDECKKFIYGGCEGNQNNFKTKEKCECQCLSD